MSYEYKAKMMLGAIQDAKDDYINATSEEDKEEYRFEIRQLENLKVLYEDAAKADEYEAKAKAWDKYKTHMESHIAGEVNEEELVSGLKSDYFESGESDA